MLNSYVKYVYQPVSNITHWSDETITPISVHTAYHVEDSM